MSKYSYSRLCTIYSYTLNGVVHRKDRHIDVCFGISLNKYVRKQNEAKYRIALIRDTSFIDSGYNNYCWMTKHQIENYLRRIASIKSFKYSVKEARYRNSPCFNIELSMRASKKEATFVLQAIKRMYEFPYNFFLLQAYKMQELPAFKFDSVLNLFNVVWASFHPKLKNSGHSFSGSTKFEKYATIREKLPQVICTSDIYPQFVEGKVAPTIKGLYYYKDVPGKTEDWTEGLFRKLLPTYIKNYKILK